MPLTPDEERQLEYLLKKKHGGAAESDSQQISDELDALPHAEPGDGSAKVHGDKITSESEE